MARLKGISLKMRMGALATGLTPVGFPRTSPRPVGLGRQAMLIAPRLATPVRPMARGLPLKLLSVTRARLVIACDELEWSF